MHKPFIYLFTVFCCIMQTDMQLTFTKLHKSNKWQTNTHIRTMLVELTHDVPPSIWPVQMLLLLTMLIHVIMLLQEVLWQNVVRSHRELWSANICHGKHTQIFSQLLVNCRLSVFVLLVHFFHYTRLVWVSIGLQAPCGLWGCKNGPAPFPGRMSYKATKPGLVSVLYLSMFLLCWCLLGPLFMYC